MGYTLHWLDGRLFLSWILFTAGFYTTKSHQMPSQLFAFDGRGTLLVKQRTFCPATKSVVGLFQKIFIFSLQTLYIEI